MKTVNDPDLTGKAKDTYPGQAHIAIGPQKCASCVFFAQIGQSITSGGVCLKTKDYNPVMANKFPGTAFACKFWSNKRKPI